MTLSKCVQVRFTFKGLISPPSEPPGEIMSFGVSPVNYSDSDSNQIQIQILKTGRCRNSHSKAFRLPSASIEAVSFPRLSGTGMTFLTLCFLLLKCQIIMCPSSHHPCVQWTNFSPIRTPSESPYYYLKPAGGVYLYHTESVSGP